MGRPVTSAAKSRSTPPPLRLRRALRARGRLLGVLLATLAVTAVWHSATGVARESSVERSFAAYMHKRGLDIDAAQLRWLDRTPSVFGVRSALFIARAGHELHDVYFADVRVAGNAVLDARSLTNITRTSSADEDRLVSVGPFVAYPARVGTTYDALVVLDTRGEPGALTADWPWYAKLQNSITNLQDSGRMRAFGVCRYNFVEAPDSLTLRGDHTRFSLEAGGKLVRIDPWRAVAERGADAIEVERVQKGQPGVITWVVDTARRVPWIGRAPVEWLEHTVFGLTDKASRAYHEVVVTDTAAEVKEALVVKDLPADDAPPPLPPPSAAKDERPPGWPPATLAPVLDHRVRGEGAWLPVNDALAPQPENGVPLFYQTFIRVDPERVYTRVYVTLWDSRQVQLGIVMGTKEPESATGETGSGEIPRDPFVISHLVAAFNGGFQAMHGEFGMMAEGRVYLPPKPYAATVAVFDDGRVGMGSWPGPGRKTWDEELANSQIPPNMIAMRQNLTSVVEGDVYNPWQRWWWGAAPEWAKEQTYIPRSGLCLTRDGHFAYFWGESMGPDELGKAMLATHCVRGLHLDMNGKHTGFELYRNFAPGAELPPLLHKLKPNSEYAGDDTNIAGYRFRGRLAVTTMTPISFPRYLERDPRDYFYLTRKPLLPGADISLAGQTLQFSTAGMPENGYPHAIARAVAPGADAVTITRIDVSRAVPAALVEKSEPAVPSRTLAALHDLARAGIPGAGEGVLIADHAHGRLRMQIVPAEGQGHPLARGTLITPQSPASDARSALGVDGEGFVVFVSARSDAALRAALAAAGLDRALGFARARLVLEDPASAIPAWSDAAPPPSAAPKAGPVADLAFVAETRPAADVMFSDVKPRPYWRWGWMQDQRVRYFPSHPARFPAPVDAKR